MNKLENLKQPSQEKLKEIFAFFTPEEQETAIQYILLLREENAEKEAIGFDGIRAKHREIMMKIRQFTDAEEWPEEFIDDVIMQMQKIINAMKIVKSTEIIEILDANLAFYSNKLSGLKNIGNKKIPRLSE